MGADPATTANPIRSVASLSDMVMEFFEDGKAEERSLAGDGDDEEEGCGGAAEKKAFWDAQNELLLAALSRTSSTEAKIKISIHDALREMQSIGNVCTCSNGSGEHCRNCMLRYISDRLRDAGYNSALCKCKWRRSPDIPSGEHSYIDVVVEAKDGKRAPIRLVIELNFRAEFQMARASQEYNILVSQLPEVFIGKQEKLKNAVKIMCGAAKQCMKENKMHIAPWRKHKYMQSKWLGVRERMQSLELLPASGKAADQLSRSRASMLTVDLHCNAVEVL